jgi:hypothetical protein
MAKPQDNMAKIEEQYGTPKGQYGKIKLFISMVLLPIKII